MVFVVNLTNTEFDPRSDLLAILLGLPYNPPVKPERATGIESEDWKAYTGVYRLDDKHIMNVTLQDGHLMIESETNHIPRSELKPLGGDRFLWPAANVIFEFTKSKDGKTEGLLLRQGKREYKWSKTGDPPMKK